MPSPTVVSGPSVDPVLVVAPMPSSQMQNGVTTGMLQTSVTAALGTYTLNSSVTQTDSVASGSGQPYLELTTNFNVQDATGVDSVSGTLDEVVSVGSSGESIQETLTITSNTSAVTVVGALGRGDGTELGTLNDTVGISPNTSGQQALAFSTAPNNPPLDDTGSANRGYVKPAVGGAIVVATSQGAFIIGGDLVQAASGNATLGSANTTAAVVAGTSNGAVTQHTVGVDFLQGGSNSLTDSGNQQYSVAGNTLQDSITYALQVAGVVPSTGQQQMINNYISSYGKTS